MTKRFFAAATALLMVLMLLPGAALAEGSTTINLEAKEGTAGAADNENCDKLFDGDTYAGSKWCVKMPTDNTGAYVIFEADDVVKVTKYTLYTAKDTKNSGRNPKDWVLYGCNDYIGTGTGTWTVIDTVTNDDTMPNEDQNYSADFTISGNTAYYKYYKLHITATQRDEIMQLGELKFTVDNTHTHNWGSETAIIPPTCTETGYAEKSCPTTSGGCGATVKYEVAALGHNYNTDGTCTCGASAPAKVGDTYYETLQKAADAAKDNGGTITLLSDITIDTPLVITGIVTLDLNGHKLSCTASDGNACAIEIESNHLTLTDSAGGGSISCPAGRGVALFTSGCYFTMNGGTITGCATGVSVSGSTFTMNGGTIESCTGNAVEFKLSSTMYAHGGAVYGSVSVGQSTITHEEGNTGSTVFYGDVSNASGNYYSGTKLGTINWGTFYGPINNWTTTQSGQQNVYPNGNITGGTFYGTVTVNSNASGGNLNITGGTFLGGIKDAGNNDSDVSISGFNNVTVTFVYPDGKTEAKTATVQNGDSFVLNGGPNDSDVKWYSDEGCTEPYAFGTAVTSPLTLYGKSVTAPTPTPTTPAVPATSTTGSGSSASLWYVGGNTFGSSKSATPTAVEIDGVAVAFTGNGSSFTVSSLTAAAKWITVRWNSTSITISFTPDANAYTANVAIPKTGDMPVWAAIAEFFGF